MSGDEDEKTLAEGEEMLTSVRTDLFFVAGSQRLTRPLTIFLRTSESATGTRFGGGKYFELGSGPVQPDVVEELVKAAHPSSFGRDKEAVLDPSYRNAHEIGSGSFALDTSLPTPEMLADIASLMQPNAPQIHAQLHKINIYGPGGLFKEHVDTPVSNAQFGSLVVALPCAFEGGELVVSHAGHTASLPLGGGAATPCPTAAPSASAAGDSPHGGPLLHFAAFFSDCRHEVLPVRSGHRITLTYNLLAANAAQSGSSAARLLSAVQPLAGGSSPLVAQLRRLLGRETWHPRGARLGYVLQHKYATSIAGLNDRMFPGILKGADRLLYAALCQEMGLKGRMAPIHLTLDDSGDDDRDAFYVGESLDRGVIKWCWYCDEEDYSKFMKDNGCERAKDTDILWVGLGRGVKHVCNLQQEIATYGNEPSTTTAYSGVVLLVKLPAWGSPERAAASGLAG